MARPGANEMPSNKDLKRLVRARMARTGESYTTARARITGEKPTLPPEHEKLAGMSDDAVRKKTGRTWRQWADVLDDLGATEMSHRDIARWVSENHDFGSWWSQTVTVGYERIRGLRNVRQRRDGSYTATKTRTLAYGLTAVARAFEDDRVRAQWLRNDDCAPRPAARSGVFRFTCPDGSRAEVRLTPKAAARTQVAVRHSGLPCADSVRERKAFWRDRLDALVELLEDGTG